MSDPKPSARQPGPEKIAASGPNDHEPKGWHSRGCLPHFDSPEISQHVIFRVFDSPPEGFVADLPVDKVLRGRLIDRALDDGIGMTPMSRPEHAGIAENALLHFDLQRYRMMSWCIMPNHVHGVFAQIAGFNLGQLIHSSKTYSARQINRLNGTLGPFWAVDYFERCIRNEEHLANTIEYVENNPVHAGLVSTAQTRHGHQVNGNTAHLTM